MMALYFFTGILCGTIISFFSLSGGSDLAPKFICNCTLCASRTCKGIACMYITETASNTLNRFCLNIPDEDAPTMIKAQFYIKIHCNSTVPSLLGASHECCYGDFCNSKPPPIRLPRVVPPPKPSETVAPHFELISTPLDDVWWQLTLVVVAVLIISGVITVLVFRSRKCSRARQFDDIQTSTDHTITQPLTTSSRGPHTDTTELLNHSCHSSSGAGPPLLQPRTIGNEINLVGFIGKGRYGEVFRGVWLGDKEVAVKIFPSQHQLCFDREVNIYKTTALRHDHILGFTSDYMKDTGRATQLWLITDYHQHGSLYDYLMQRSIDVHTCLKMAQSIADGLAYLHTEFVTKPAIAHRDLKSGNILVKKDLTCCIADFGLAVKYESVSDKLDIDEQNVRSGTIRYLPPEVLARSIKPDTDYIKYCSFSSFACSDVYSMALCLWELAWRTELDTGASTSSSSPSSYRPLSEDSKVIYNIAVNEHSLPFAEQAPTDPSIDKMYEIVVLKRVRPHILDSWRKHPKLASYADLLSECWDQTPSTRRTAKNVAKRLRELCGFRMKHV